MTERAAALLGWILARRTPLWIALGCVELAGVLILLVLVPPPIDLQVYRLGAQALVHGHTLYQDLPPALGNISLPFIYPPVAAVLLAPLTLMDVFTAEVVFNFVSVLAVAVTMYAVFRELYRRGVLHGTAHPPQRLAVRLTLLVLPFALFLEPVRETELFGQINSVLMAMVAVDCLLLRHTRYRGLLIGLAAAVKLTPAAFVLFFLLRKDLRGVIGVVLGGIVGTAIGFLATPSDSMRFLTTKLIGDNMIGAPEYATNQTLNGMWARMIPTNPAAQNVLWIVSLLALIVVMVIAMRRAFAAHNAGAALAVNAIGGLLLSPASWSHHWVWVAPALLLCSVAAFRARSRPLGFGTAFLALTTYVGPMWFAPRDNQAELHWTPFQLFYGNAYVLFASVALVIAAVRIGARNRRPALDEVGVPAGRGA